MSEDGRLRIGTRSSRLALWQAGCVEEALRDRWPDLQLDVCTFSTEGDRRASTPLAEMSGRGVFTSDLAQRLRRNQVDLVVHSLKDLPTENDPDLAVAAVSARHDPRECLVARDSLTLQDLPAGAVVGTSSVRRRAQLAALRPDLEFRPIRGNVETRIAKVLDQGLYDATVLAAAGLCRLGLQECATQWFDVETLLPAPGQGALAVQCRRDDSRTWELVSAIDNPVLRTAVTLERRFLRELGGGCALPVAALAQPRPDGNDGEYWLRGSVFSCDGRDSIVVSGSGSADAGLALSLAGQALEQGALRLLSNSDRALSLQGKRIVVTRSAHQARYLEERLVQLGAMPILLPTIRIVDADPTPRVRGCVEGLPGYDWLVFTSANAVQRWWRLAPATGRLAGRGKIRVAAIGPATGQALREHACQPDVLPAGIVAEQLARRLGNLEGKRCLLPRGDRASQGLPEALRRLGAEVDCITVYRTRSLPPQPGRMDLLQEGVDAVTFTSGSTVRNFLAEVEAHSRGRALVKGCLIACIGPRTAETARRLGLKVDLVADNYTVEGLVEALIEYYDPAT